MRTITTIFCYLLIIHLLLSATPVFSQLETLKIGSQEWTSRNLETSHFSNGDSIRQARNSIDWLVGIIQQQPMWCYYNYNAENGRQYGKLYSWYALIDPRGLAPAGYHLPSDMEWTKLEDFLGGRIAAGVKLALADSRGAATNQSGFSGMPSGILLKEDSFEGIGFMTTWWTSTPDTSILTWTRMLSFAGDMERISVDRLFGLAVRCVKDVTVATKKTAALRKTAVTNKVPATPRKNKVRTVPVKVNPPIAEKIAVTNNASVKRATPANPVVVNTEPVKMPVRGTMMDLRDGGKIYQTVQISRQNWMAENLQVITFRNGETIPHASTKEEWTRASDEQTPAWCFYDFDLKNEPFGKLYNWFAVNDARVLAPIGWHVPVLDEYNTLIGGLGYYSQALVKLRSDSGWIVSTAGSNESGFNAIPGGFCYANGEFVGKGNRAFFWNASEEPSKKTHAQYFAIYYFDDIPGWTMSLVNTPFQKTSGMSVRCVQD